MNVKEFTGLLTAVTGFIAAMTALYHEYRMDRDSKKEAKRQSSEKEDKD